MKWLETVEFKQRNCIQFTHIIHKKFVSFFQFKIYRKKEQFLQFFSFSSPNSKYVCIFKKYQRKNGHLPKKYFAKMFSQLSTCFLSKSRSHGKAHSFETDQRSNNSRQKSTGIIQRKERKGGWLNCKKDTIHRLHTLRIFAKRLFRPTQNGEIQKKREREKHIRTPSTNRVPFRDHFGMSKLRKT